MIITRVSCLQIKKYILFLLSEIEKIKKKSKRKAKDLLINYKGCHKLNLTAAIVNHLLIWDLLITDLRKLFKSDLVTAIVKIVF